MTQSTGVALQQIAESWPPLLAPQLGCCLLVWALLAWGARVFLRTLRGLVVTLFWVVGVLPLLHHHLRVLVVWVVGALFPLSPPLPLLLLRCCVLLWFCL